MELTGINTNKITAINNNLSSKISPINNSILIKILISHIIEESC
jgi:hypothetical protein